MIKKYRKVCFAYVNFSNKIIRTINFGSKLKKCGGTSLPSAKNSSKIGSTFFGAGETLCKSAVTDKAIYFYVVNG